MPFTICSTIVIHLSYQTMGESKENLVRMLADNWAFGGVSGSPTKWFEKGGGVE